MKLPLLSSLLIGLLAVLNPAVPTEGSAATLSTLKNMDYRYFVAGGTCAAFSHGITTPIDVVKTKIQSNPKVSSMYHFLTGNDGANALLHIDHST